MTIITQTNLKDSTESTTENEIAWRHSRYPYTVNNVIYDHTMDVAKVVMKDGNSQVFNGTDSLIGLDWAVSEFLYNR